MRGKKAKALRALVYGGRVRQPRVKGVDGRTHRPVRRPPLRYPGDYARGTNGGIVAREWRRREYQGLKAGYVGPHLRAWWANATLSGEDVLTMKPADAAVAP